MSVDIHKYVQIQRYLILKNTYNATPTYKGLKRYPIFTTLPDTDKYLRCYPILTKPYNIAQYLEILTTFSDTLKYLQCYKYLKRYPVTDSDKYLHCYPMLTTLPST